MTIYQGIEEMLTPYTKLYDKKKASTVQTILGEILQRNNIL